MILFLISGVLAAFFALVFELLLGSVPGLGYLTILTPLSLMLFALIEETTKLSVLWKVSKANKDIPFFPAGTGAFALGFGLTELLIARSTFPDIPPAAIAGILLVHIGTIFLYGFVLEKAPGTRLALALASGTLLHFLYNYVTLLS